MFIYLLNFFATKYSTTMQTKQMKQKNALGEAQHRGNATEKRNEGITNETETTIK